MAKETASNANGNLFAEQFKAATRTLRRHVELANTLAVQLARLHGDQSELEEKLLNQSVDTAAESTAAIADKAKPDDPKGATLSALLARRLQTENPESGLSSSIMHVDTRYTDCPPTPGDVCMEQKIKKSSSSTTSPSKPHWNSEINDSNVSDKLHRQISPSRPVFESNLSNFKESFSHRNSPSQLHLNSEIGDPNVSDKFDRQISPSRPRFEPKINFSMPPAHWASEDPVTPSPRNDRRLLSPRNLQAAAPASPTSPSSINFNSFKRSISRQHSAGSNATSVVSGAHSQRSESDDLETSSNDTAQTSLGLIAEPSSATIVADAVSSRRVSSLPLFNFNRGSTKSEVFAKAGLSIASSSIWVVNPERSQALEKWDGITMLSLLFVAIVTPVQISMTDCVLECPILFVVNSIVDLVFFLDLFLQFFLMYPKKTNFGHALEYRHNKIVEHYLKTWFIIDLLSIVPFDLMSALSNSEGMSKMKAIKVIRLMRLLKLVRVLKASRLFRRFEVRMSFTYQRLALLKFFVVLAALTHWMACLWALTLMLVDEDSGIPRWVSVFDEEEVNVVHKTKDSIWKLYVACLYFTSYTITSVGYGDIGPQNIVERIACTIIILLSGISWAMVLGQVCGIVGNMDADEQHFRKTMDELNYMMDDRQLPKMMCRRLRSFFLANKLAQRHKHQRQILDSMSPGLQGEVVMEMNRTWLGKVGFLNSLLNYTAPEDMNGFIIKEYLHSFVHDLAREMQHLVYAQGEIFGMYQILYILNQGLVSHRRQIRRAGAIWGQDFLLSDLTLHHSPRCVALTYVAVMVLARANFLEILEKFSRECPEVYSQVRRYVCRLAMQRGIMAEAKKRIAEQREKRETEAKEKVAAAKKKRKAKKKPSANEAKKNIAANDASLDKQHTYDLRYSDAMSTASDSLSI